MAGTIVLIGGGEIVNRGSAEIDRYLLGLAGKRPTVAFISAAFNDTDYVRSFMNYCRSIGGGEILPILLSKESQQSIKKKIQQAQVIYFGSGDAKSLISSIKQKGLLIDLNNALKDGKVIAGISGGAVSVCKDSIIRKAEKKPKAAVSLGMGLTNVCVDINYLEANDREISILSKKLGRVYAISSGAGIAIRDENVTMIGDSSKVAIFEKGTKVTALTSLRRPF